MSNKTKEILRLISSFGMGASASYIGLKSGGIIGFIMGMVLAISIVTLINFYK